MFVYLIYYYYHIFNKLHVGTSLSDRRHRRRRRRVSDVPIIRVLIKLFSSTSNRNRYISNCTVINKIKKYVPI